MMLMSGAVVLFSSCKKNNDPVPDITSSRVEMTTTSTAANVTGALVTEFRINIEKIEFRTSKDDPILPRNDIQVAPLVGPFSLLLVGDGEGDIIPEAPLPDAIYDRIRFDVIRGGAAPMNNISVSIKGTIGDVPFVMWHDVEPTFQSNLNLTVDSKNFSFGIDFVLDGLDLSGAADGDGNGTIEISPNDPDGNNNLADDILVFIENNYKVNY